MRLWMIFSLFLLLAGCESAPPSIPYSVGQRIRVTAAYDTHVHKQGDEYLFSLILPQEEEWIYTPKYEMERSGIISTYAKHARREVTIEWNWINRYSATTKNVIKETPFYLPWYSGQKGDGRRVAYAPTGEQIKSGDWYRVGYPQRQFNQSMYKGNNKFYCVRSVVRRGGRTTWDQEHQPSIYSGPTFEIYDACPFRTTDGRDAYLMLSIILSILEKELASNPNALDERLDAMDAWLKPMWDSLEVMPKAYQFDAPVNAIP